MDNKHFNQLQKIIHYDLSKIGSLVNGKQTEIKGEHISDVDPLEFFIHTTSRFNDNALFGLNPNDNIMFYIDKDNRILVSIFNYETGEDDSDYIVYAIDRLPAGSYEIIKTTSDFLEQKVVLYKLAFMMMVCGIILVDRASLTRASKKIELYKNQFLEIFWDTFLDNYLKGNCPEELKNKLFLKDVSTDETHRRYS